MGSRIFDELAPVEKLWGLKGAGEDGAGTMAMRCNDYLIKHIAWMYLFSTQHNTLRPI